MTFQKIVLVYSLANLPGSTLFLMWQFGFGSPFQGGEYDPYWSDGQHYVPITLALNCRMSILLETYT
jgi:hypothetical protein